VTSVTNDSEVVAASEYLLEVRDGVTGYGKTKVLHDISLRAQPGEVVGILGTNGAGKSTLARLVAGILPQWQGTVWVNGDDVTKLKAYERVERGVCLVPEGGGAFRGLSVKENLQIGGTSLRRADVEDQLGIVYELFPVLKERGQQDAGLLSGGERQMLAVGRALMSRPRLLILDEPSIGLSPLALDRLFGAVGALVQSGQAGDNRFALLLTEQNVHEACRIADRAYVLNLGHLVAEIDHPKPEQVAALIAESLSVETRPPSQPSLPSRETSPVTAAKTTPSPPEEHHSGG
jgi:branched-chain amino acid transport system ATP-binding protein